MPLESLGIVAQLLAASGDAFSLILDSKHALTDAERNMKLAEAARSLARAELAVAAAMRAQAAADAEILRLREALALQGKVEKRGDACFRVTESGIYDLNELCVNCWASDHRLVPLTHDAGQRRTMVCPQCKHQIDWGKIRHPEADERAPSS